MKLTVRHLRLASGLVLFTYVAFHLANHATMAVSLAAAEAYAAVMFAFVRLWPVQIVLYGALATHLALALYAIYVRRDLRASHGALIALLNKLRDPAMHDKELEESFQRDLPLSYKLLRIVNSAAMGRREVWSIGHAIRLLGRGALYQWLSLLLLGGGASGGVQDELSRASLARGRLCELLGTAAGVPRAGPSLFITGFFSLLDVVLGVPMNELVGQLDLASDVRAALLAREDFYGAVLALAEAYEEGDWAAVLVGAADVGVEAAEIPALFRESLAWAKAQRATDQAAA